MHNRETFSRILRNAYVTAAISMIMALTGLVEAMAPFFDSIQGNETKIGAHHGVAIYGLYMSLRALGEILDGTREMKEGILATAAALGGQPEEAARD